MMTEPILNDVKNWIRSFDLKKLLLIIQEFVVRTIIFKKLEKILRNNQENTYCLDFGFD